MYRSFKNLELFRYYVSSNIEKSIDAYTEQSKQSSLQTASSLFSVAFSIVATYLSNKFLANYSIPNMVITILIVFLGGYFVAYNAFGLVFKLYETIRDQFKSRKQKSTPKEIKLLIDDFDHIACDNVLIAQEFINYCESLQDKDLFTFNYYEVIYYLKTSVIKTLRIVDNPACVNNKNKNDAVDLYRICNLLDMMVRIYNYVISEKNNVKIDPKLRMSLKHKLDLLGSDIDDIDKKCKELIDNY